MFAGGAVSGQDSTAAIQAAVTLASSGATTGGPVYIPPGLWITEAPITGANKCVIYGAGPWSVIQPRFAGGAVFSLDAAANVRFQSFKIDGSMGTPQDGIYLHNTVMVVIDGVVIDGNGAGFTRAGLTVDGGNGFNSFGITCSGWTWITRCAGDGVFFVPGTSYATITIFNSHVQGNTGNGIDVASGAATASSVHTIYSIIEGNGGTGWTGSVWAGSIVGCHFESVGGVGTSSIKVTGAQRFIGLTISANFIENHRLGAPGSYCVELNPTGVVSPGLEMAGNFFDLSTVAGAFVNNLVEAARIGPNFSNLPAYAPGTFGGGVYVLDSGNAYDEQAILRTFAPGDAGCIEKSAVGLQTIGATTATFDYPLTVAGFGPATAFTGVIRYKITVIGRNALNRDFFLQEMKATFSNVAGAVTIGSAGAIVVDSDSLGAGAGGAVTLTVNGSNARTSVTGWAGQTVYWTVTWEADGRP